MSRAEELPDEIERLVMDILDDPDEVRGRRLDRLCEEHPGHAGRIRQRLRAADALAQDIGREIDAAIHPLAAAGERIGPYRIVDVLGEGGMGTVYLADQETPVRRRVAVKVIKPGMDTRQVLMRFEAERQALAVLDHPGIATIFDAGVTPEGRSYFAMEFVPGEPVTAYCDSRQTPVRRRLELFLEVCAAVQHAHQKGIIHRDLKPSNILVRDDADRPSPRIIDFGLARATEASLTDETLHTLAGSVVGTPEYMSPEQADLSCRDVDTRTDVYSLGVVLYELLVGALPLDQELLRRDGLDGMRQRIREAEPPIPSRRVSKHGPASATAAVDRHTDVPGLARLLRGDLDWITMQALEKDRDRRYQTVAELAADLRRHLRDEPVAARPPSALYRLGKLYRRRKLQVIAAAAVLLALVTGLVVSTSLYLDLRSAQHKAAVARDTATANRDALLLAGLLAEAEDIRPAWPERVGQADRWLEQAEGLIARMDRYRAELASIERRSRLVPVDAALASRQESEDALAQLEGSWRSFNSYWRTDRLISEDKVNAMVRRNDLFGALAETVPLQIARARRRAASRPVRSFADRADAERHAALVELTEGMAELGTRKQEVLHRRDRALAVDRVCFGDHGAEWQRTVSAIADRQANPRYQGLRVRRQRGLFPIGADPVSGLFEFAHYLSGQPPQRDPKTGALQLGPETCLVFVLLPAAAIEGGMARFRGPTVACFLSKYEMTQGQWRRLTGGNPSYYPTGTRIGGTTVTDRHPVTNVSWHDAYQVLSSLDLTLPRTALWQYAAWTAPDASRTPVAISRHLRSYANLADAAFQRQWRTAPALPWDDGFPIHAPVGSFRANPLGFHDLYGNVSEWALDTELAKRRDVKDEDMLRRIFLGWSFVNRPAKVTPAPQAESSLLKSTVRGFRPARDIQG